MGSVEMRLAMCFLLVVVAAAAATLDANLDPTDLSPDLIGEDLHRGFAGGSNFGLSTRGSFSMAGGGSFERVSDASLGEDNAGGVSPLHQEGEHDVGAAKKKRKVKGKAAKMVDKAKTATKSATDQVGKAASASPKGPDFSKGLWQWAHVHNSIYSKKCERLTTMTRLASKENPRALICVAVYRNMWAMAEGPKSAKGRGNWPFWGCCDGDGGDKCRQTVSPLSCPVRDRSKACKGGNICFVGTWKMQESNLKKFVPSQNVIILRHDKR